MDMTAKQLVEWILQKIKEGWLQENAPVSTAEGFSVWEQNIRIQDGGKRLVL